jgi:hypothetical protein
MGRSAASPAQQHPYRAPNISTRNSGNLRCWPGMRWFGYAWLILFNTFCIVVVLAVFAKLFERPDVILVAILGLIYIAIEMRGVAQNVGITEGLMQLRKQVLEVRRLLNDANFGSEAENIWQTEKAISDVMPRYYINQFFRGLISLICLFVIRQLNQRRGSAPQSQRCVRSFDAPDLVLC